MYQCILPTKTHFQISQIYSLCISLYASPSFYDSQIVFTFNDFWRSVIKLLSLLHALFKRKKEGIKVKNIKKKFVSESKPCFEVPHIYFVLRQNHTRVFAECIRVQHLQAEKQSTRTTPNATPNVDSIWKSLQALKVKTS